MHARKKPHIEGNFIVLVYLELTNEGVEVLEKLSRNILNILPAQSAPVHSIAPADWHMSLSRSVVIKSHLLESVLDDITGALSQYYSCGSQTVFLSPQVKVYSDDTGCVCFGGVPADLDVSPSVLGLIGAVDMVFRKYSLEEYFKDPSPHVSLCWWNPNVPVSPSVVCETIEIADTSKYGVVVEDLRIDFSHVCMQVGNQLHRIAIG